METYIRGDRMNMAIAHLLSNAIKMMVSRGVIGKQSEFAERVHISENILNKKLTGLTPIHLEEWWIWRAKIEELDPDYAHRYLITTLLGKTV